MATDGVKIIDGDLAHDIYWGIMDLYDNGTEIEEIKKQIPFPPQNDYYDAFDYEVYITAYALAAWEIGFIDNQILSEVKKVIDTGACTAIWTKEYGEKAGKSRANELSRFWKKINILNSKPRKPKKYNITKDFVFEPNDVLSFELLDQSFCCTIVLNISQYRGKCNYEFGKIKYKSKDSPGLNDIPTAEILGRKIPSGFGMDMNKILSLSVEEIISKGGLDKLLLEEAESTGSYIIGMSKISINHNNLKKFKNKFKLVGKINLKEQCRETGSLKVAASFEEFADNFCNPEKDLIAPGDTFFIISELMKHP